MQTRSIGETIQCFNETSLPKRFFDSETCKSLLAAVLTFAAHPNEHSHKHFERCLWKSYGWLDAKLEVGLCSPHSEERIRILLMRLESFFA